MVKQLRNLDKTYKDVNVEDVTSFDDMIASTQEPLSDEDIVASFISVETQQETDEEDSFREVSEIIVKTSPTQFRTAIETLMDYSMITGTSDLQGFVIKASSILENDMRKSAKQKIMTDFFVVE